MPQGREICPTGQRGDSEAQHPRRTNPERGPPPSPVLLLGGDSTAPLGKRAAAAALKASPKAGSMTQLKTGNASAAPPVAKPLTSSPSKGKSVRGGKHQPKPPYVTSSSHINGAFLFEFSHGPWYLDYARTCTVPCACELRRLRKTVAARARARVAPVRGGPQWFWRHERRQQVGERSRKGEKEGKPAKDGTSNPNRDGGGRRKEDDARARGGPAAATQPGILSAPTILQRETMEAPPRASQEAPPTDAISPWRLPTLTRPPP